MTAVEPERRPAPPDLDDPVIARPELPMCPYLAAVDGQWRSPSVAREHRCGAVSPPAILAAEKQRRLCLTANHVACSTFEAARAARPIAHGRAQTLPRPLARTTPVVLDHGRITIAMPAFRSDRSTGQAILIVLLAFAFALIVLAKLTGGGSPVGLLDASPSPHGSAVASGVPASGRTTARPTATPAAAPSASAASSRAPASAGPSASAVATPTAALQTYKVKPGDTLVGIAAKFGTTPKAIAKLNGITNASNLHVGQILKIP